MKNAIFMDFSMNFRPKWIDFSEKSIFMINYNYYFPKNPNIIVKKTNFCYCKWTNT